MKIPRRLSLVTQVVEAIDSGTRAGTWIERLPPERELAVALQVSRPTLRKALAMLERQGRIEKGGRLGPKITANFKSAGEPSHLRNVGVLILSSGRELAVTPAIARSLLKIQQCLHDAGYEMALHFQQARQNEKSLSKIAELVRKNPSVCWLLMRANAEVQEWFRGQKIPAAVVGSTSEAVGMPAFDIDYRAVCRHAGQLFWRRGHRQIAMIVPVSNLIGDQLSERGFLEGLSQMEHPDKRIQILRYEGDIESVKRILDKALAQASPPTAILITRATSTLTALGHLHAHGYKVPRDISIISRDHEEFLLHVVPVPAHYVVDWQSYGGQIAKCLLGLAEQSGFPTHGKIIFPFLEEGGTISSPPDR